METSAGPEGGKKIDWRQFGRHWIVVFILAVLAAFVIWGMLQAGPWLRQWQEWRAARTLQNELEKLYRNDKYGGKAPEETFDMFIAALEKGDIELASKYFVIEKQESWLKTLEEYKKEGLVGDFANELKNTTSKWVKVESNDPNVAQYDSATEITEGTTITMKSGEKINVPKGNYANATIFKKYPSGVWKIGVL